MDTFRFWQKWLLVVSYAITAMGLIIAFSTLTLFFDLSDKLYNPIFWGTKSISAETARYQIWNFGVLGPIIAGWGIFYIFIVRHPFKKKEPWSWNCLFLGTIVWFIIDNGYSVYYLVYPNIVLNTILCASILVPLLFTRKEFKG